METLFKDVLKSFAPVLHQWEATLNSIDSTSPTELSRLTAAHKDLTDHVDPLATPPAFYDNLRRYVAPEVTKWPGPSKIENWKTVVSKCMSDLDLLRIPVATTALLLQDERMSNKLTTEITQCLDIALGAAYSNAIEIDPANFPSGQPTLETYRLQISGCPSVCFQEFALLTELEMLPDLRQDKHDIERDTLRLNGVVMKCKTKPAAYEDVLTAVSKATGLAEGADAVATMLLHLCNRTLAGGRCLDSVLRVYAHHSVHVVPHSAGAEPLDLVISPNGIAALRTHIGYRIFDESVGDGILAEVDGFYIAQILLHELQNPKVLAAAAKKLKIDAEASNAVPPSWIEVYENSDDEGIDEVPALHWRTYVKFRRP